MGRNPSCSVFIGNLDEKVTERILYEILIQVGRVVDLYIPRDKETNRHKGYAFAEYESEEIADYAVRLLSGLTRLYNKTLRFAISGQDKPSQNNGTPVTPKPNSPLPRPHPVHLREMEMWQGSAESINCRVSAYTHSVSPNYPQASAHGFVNNGVSSSNFDYSKRVFGSFLANANRSDSRNPMPYPYSYS